MTDTPPTDPADDDLLASLYLDGEATADERARVEADPELMARVRSFEAMASDLAEVTPPPDLSRIQISAALDVFDQLHTTTPVAATPVVATPMAATPAAVPTEASPVSEVSSLSERRERKQARGIPNWLSAAAALALVVGGLGFVSTLGGGQDDSTTASDAMDSTEALSSGANRLEESAATTVTQPDIEAEASMIESDDGAMDATSADEATDEEEAMEEEAMEEAMDDAGEESGAEEIAASPVPLDGLAATTAAEYLELLEGQPFEPIENSPCAGSPLVEGLFGVDSYIEVVYEGEVSSLLVQAGVPSTAVIVGPTCEIELE